MRGVCDHRHAAMATQKKRYPAVLVRLKAVSVPELRALITEAWRCQAPKAAKR
jgi:hypothetical protein